MTLETLNQQRLARWRQDGKRNVPDPVAAIGFIEEMGLCPLYRASPEFPDLFHAHTSDPNTQADAKWDSVSGEIYTWRWSIGKKESAFYAAMVAKKPTWVAWPLLPSCLAALMERRTHDELFDAGLISADAHRLASALEDADGVLSTKELRIRGGFPTGKEYRKAYLHAVEELEGFFLLAKKMSEEDGCDDMSHALISSYYRKPTEQALAMTREEGLIAMLKAYVRGSVYVVPELFAKAMRLDKGVLLGVLAGLVERKEVCILEDSGKAIYYDSEIEAQAKNPPKQ